MARKDRDCMVIKFTATYGIKKVIITAKSCEFESRSWQDIRDTTIYICDLHGSFFPE